MLKLICKFDYKEKKRACMHHDQAREWASKQASKRARGKESGEEVIENNKCKETMRFVEQESRRIIYDICTWHTPHILLIIHIWHARI